MNNLRMVLLLYLSGVNLFLQETEDKYNSTVNELAQKTKKLQVNISNSVYVVLLRFYTYPPMQETESTVEELAKKLQVITY